MIGYESEEYTKEAHEMMKTTIQMVMLSRGITSVKQYLRNKETPRRNRDKIKKETLQVDQALSSDTCIRCPPVEIHPINSSADEEGGTTVLGCDQNDASIQKEMQKRHYRKLLNLWELRERLDQSERILQVKIHNPKKMCRYYHKLWHLKKITIIAEGTVYKSDGKIMLHNKALPKDCYKVSIDKSLVDAAFIPDVGSNGCTTVLDAVGGFVAWPKNQVVFDPKATPPSTIQMIIVENKTAPKVPTKRKNFYVSSDAMQKEANKKRSQKALVY
ncbi:hypothetical protein Tco_0813080 [Tanacetum coccineum]